MERLLQHDSDGPRADGQAGAGAAPVAAPRGLRAGVRALAGVPRRVPAGRLRAGQASAGGDTDVYIIFVR